MRETNSSLFCANSTVQSHQSSSTYFVKYMNYNPTKKSLIWPQVWVQIPTFKQQPVRTVGTFSGLMWSVLIWIHTRTNMNFNSCIFLHLSSSSFLFFNAPPPFALSLQTARVVCCCRGRQARRATHSRSINRLSLMRDTERPRGLRPDSLSLSNTDTNTYSIICECKEKRRKKVIRSKKKVITIPHNFAPLFAVGKQYAKE